MSPAVGKLNERSRYGVSLDEPSSGDLISMSRITRDKFGARSNNHEDEGNREFEQLLFWELD